MPGSVPVIADRRDDDQNAGIPARRIGHRMVACAATIPILAFDDKPSNFAVFVKLLNFHCNF